MKGVTVAVRRLDPGLPLPSRAHDDDAGLDLYARDGLELPPGGRALVATGIAMALPRGLVGLVHPRSGLAARHGVTVLNAPGTVDSGYRGEIMVNLINHDPHRTVVLSRGDRIAQLVVQEVVPLRWHEVDSLPDTDRGDKGHGASGGIPSPATVPQESTTDVG